ncbi:MAG TPA: YqaE/Pmp3 family membrane protein [Bacteroidia bacterium]|jgi:uncharacterized membrane protein YqaE (UPF0057 family)|nr:YqaE/Pmp3 family membrane protein [Bacteroidia bacterium]
MKKQFTSVLLAVAIGILLSSCSNLPNLSLTKRHYRSGYYVNFSKKNNTSPTSAKLASVKHKDQAPIPELIKPEIPIIKASTSNNSIKKNVADLEKTVKLKENMKDNYVVSYTTANSKPDDLAPTISAGNNLYSGAEGEVNARVEVNVSMVVIVLCAIFIPPLGVALMYGIHSYFWIDLLLTLLFFIPGMIFALVVVLM